MADTEAGQRAGYVGEIVNGGGVILTGQHRYASVFMLLQLLRDHAGPDFALLGVHITQGAIVGLQLAVGAHGTM